MSILFIFLFLFGCLDSEENNQKQELKESEIELYSLYLESIFTSDYVVADAQDELKFEVRKCNFEKGMLGEKPLLLAFERPIISIHSLEGTPERNTVIAGTQINDKNYVQTVFAPLITLAIINKGKTDSGEIRLSFDVESNGDLTFANVERFSWGAGYRTKFPEDLVHKHYFITEENEYVFFDADKIGSEDLSENEIVMDELTEAKILTLCNDGVLDYSEFLGVNFPCRQSFKEIQIENLQPNEIAKISFFYFPMQRISFESKYPVNPKYQFPIKEKENELTEIKIYYANNVSKELLLKINLSHSLNEFSFDEILDNCQ